MKEETKLERKISDNKEKRKKNNKLINRKAKKK